MDHLKSILTKYQNEIRRFRKKKDSYFDSDKFIINNLRDEIFLLTDNSDKIHLLSYLAYESNKDIDMFDSLGKNIMNLLTKYSKIEDEKGKWVIPKNQKITVEHKAGRTNNLIDQIIKNSKPNRTISQEKVNNEKFIWKKDKKDLAFLIDKLVELGFLAESKKINKLVSLHFLYENADKDIKVNINPNEISDLKSKVKNPNYPLHPSKEIEEVISKTIKQSNTKQHN